MLHEVRLPQVTLERLTDVVVLQTWLLFYAASKTSLNSSDKSDCARKLDKCPRFVGRGAQIADWIWNAEARLKPLREFSQSTEVSPFAKKNCIQRLSRDIFGLLNGTRFNISPFDGTDDWQVAIADFFKYFYTGVLRETPKISKIPFKISQVTAGFPDYIFSDPLATRFGAQEFLRAFQKENKTNLTICPACDEAPYSISAGSVYVVLDDRKIEADIDHYLPKHLYPHLACHPYNLVPTCLPCNQRKKKTEDPLRTNQAGTSRSRSLADIHKPYRDGGLGQNTYLEIDLSNSFKEPIILSLQERNGHILQEAISVLGDVYGIPEGWQDTCDTQAELLFNDLYYLLDTHDSPFNSPEIIDWLDEYLYKLLTKWGREGYAILRTWLLVSYILETIAVFDQSGNKIGTTPLLQELEVLCGIQDTDSSSRLLSKSSIRQRIQDARSWREQQIS
ncbi:hypothetical protein ACQ4N7_13590 [Nodosilinea sp. AN01ver1]|uniref:hypothetical protein n=1 Tax=Nodosilinea sp. AN01ver1 TaxID=3423362 RepID=UPI003D322170